MPSERPAREAPRRASFLDSLRLARASRAEDRDPADLSDAFRMLLDHDLGSEEINTLGGVGHADFLLGLQNSQWMGDEEDEEDEEEGGDMHDHDLEFPTFSMLLAASRTAECHEEARPLSETSGLDEAPPPSPSSHLFTSPSASPPSPPRAPRNPYLSPMSAQKEPASTSSVGSRPMERRATTRLMRRCASMQWALMDQGLTRDTAFHAVAMKLCTSPTHNCERGRVENPSFSDAEVMKVVERTGFSPEVCRDILSLRSAICRVRDSGKRQDAVLDELAGRISALPSPVDTHPSPLPSSPAASSPRPKHRRDILRGEDPVAKKRRLGLVGDKPDRSRSFGERIAPRERAWVDMEDAGGSDEDGLRRPKLNSLRFRNGVAPKRKSDPGSFGPRKKKFR